MKYNLIGKSDLKVSKICLGTMTMGTQNNSEQSHNILNYAFDNGINFIDTAEQYPSPSSEKFYGKTEEIVGEWFKKKQNRNDIILATKMSGPGVPWIRGGGLQYNNFNIRKAVEGSLKRLNTDFIDLYQLHWPERFYQNFAFDPKIKFNDNFNKLESILSSFQQLIKEGKIRYLGLSNEDLNGLKAYVDLIKKNNFPEIVSMQNRYNLLYRNYDKEIIEFCKSNQISFLGYSPLAFGMLSGKHIDKPETESRIALYPEYFNRYSGKESKKSVIKYSKISQQNNLKLVEMSMSYCFHKSFLTSSIIGSTSINQLKEILDAFKIDLNPQIINQINLVHSENKNPTYETEFKIYNYLRNALALIFEGNFLDFYKKTIKFIKRITKIN
ncbi:aldo/keto reductase [bacterium]|nr:aldo/keto reductase [bacterium]